MKFRDSLEHWLLVTKRATNRLPDKLAYFRWIPNYVRQSFTRRSPRGPVHVILAIADHFEPAIVPGNGSARADYREQEQRVECWCRDYPGVIGKWHDDDGFPLRHTYFDPAEQYDRALVGRLAEHCRSGWGEIEVDVHHGMETSDTAENTRRQLIRFRDTLASEHRCLAYEGQSQTPRYAFVHGNFALANSAGGYGCGVDCEIELLAETGCYADLTLPASTFHPAQIAKMLGAPMQKFLRELVEGAPKRDETLHFVTAREMVNIVLAACDGKNGNPGEYRDCHFRRSRPALLNIETMLPREC